MYRDMMDHDERRIVFHSALPRESRSAMEALFFFHPRQPALQAGIHAAVARLGMPTIVERNGYVWIDVPPGRTQCLIACDEAVKPPRVVGIVLYSRPAMDTIWITHLAIDPDYAHGSKYAGLQASARLVDRVMDIARSIRGIDRIQLPYRHERYLRVTRAESPLFR